ncbi:MAG: type II toxin-antitoxin system Phd/YefM family antitoxin [Bradymonadales bacterium]|nr:type II toxin-antitoxin system Phd/YefM family antitoxin [Bradymonadales bacterium]
MKTISATDFKAKCLKILDELEPSGIVVTKRGQPIARVLPFKETSLEKLYGCMKGDVEVHGDIMSTGERWDAEP